MSEDSRHWQAGIDGPLGAAAQKKRLGLLSDVDGTLSPILDDADAAAISPNNQALLRELVKELDLVGLISGRRVVELVQRADIPGVVLIGNHGMERWENGQAIISEEAGEYRDNLEALIAELEGLLEGGTFVEDKGATVTLHYRLSDDPKRFAESSKERLSALAEKQGLRFSQGRMVFEFKPPIEVDKGTVLKGLAIEHELDALFFLGDDMTDIAALQAARALREDGLCEAWGIAVRSDEGAAAVAEAGDYAADGVADVERFLDWLLKALRASST